MRGMNSIVAEIEAQMFVDDWLTYVSCCLEVPANERELISFPPCLALSKWLARGFILPEYAIQVILAQLCASRNNDDPEIHRKVSIIFENATKAFEREYPSD